LRSQEIAGVLLSLLGVQIVAVSFIAIRRAVP
jgi:hypothetical protein